MTDEMMNVRSLVEKSADADLLREMDWLCGRAADKAGYRQRDRARYGGGRNGEPSAIVSVNHA